MRNSVHFTLLTISCQMSGHWPAELIGSSLHLRSQAQYIRMRDNPGGGLTDNALIRLCFYLVSVWNFLTFQRL